MRPDDRDTPSVASIAQRSLDRAKAERHRKEIAKGAGCDKCGMAERLPGSLFCDYCAREMDESAQHIVQTLLDEVDHEQSEFPFLDPSAAEIVRGTLQRARAESGKPIDDYSIHDLGVMDSSYFQGAGLHGTRWDVVYVGTGETGYEALEQATDEAASEGWNVRSIANEFPEHTNDTVTNAVREANPEMVNGDDDVDTGECYYYVTLYIKGEHAEE